VKDPGLAHLGRVADLLEEAARHLRGLVGSSGDDLDPLGGNEAECRRGAPELAPQNPMQSEQPSLLTRREVADLLRIGERSLARWRNDPKAKFPKPIRRGRVVRWRRAQIETWLEARR
jgi:predicted DNA-binding transcriptional regulator AlpA